MCADLATFFDQADAEARITLFEPDRGSQARRPATDDNNIKFHGFTISTHKEFVPALSKRRREFAHGGKKISHQPVVGDLKDRRVGILVDGDDDFGFLHARQMLNGTGDADGDVKLSEFKFAVQL